MKEDAPEQKVKQYCGEVRKEISHWKDINQNGCNDPFWPDGCNMNLTRNHIIYGTTSFTEPHHLLPAFDSGNLYGEPVAVSGRILFFTTAGSG